MLRGRVYPSDGSFPLRVACVHGRQQSGMLVCALPILGSSLLLLRSKCAARAGNDLHARIVKKFHSSATQTLSESRKKCLRLDELAVRSGKPFTKCSRHLTYKTSTLSRPLWDQTKCAAVFLARSVESDLFQNWSSYCNVTAQMYSVGESGVGKTSLLVDAVRIVERDCVQVIKMRRRRRRQNIPVFGLQARRDSSRA